MDLSTKQKSRLLEDAQRLALAAALLKDEIDAFVRDMHDMVKNGKPVKEVKKNERCD